MTIYNTEEIIKGRKDIDAYREAHTALHSKSWHNEG